MGCNRINIESDCAEVVETMQNEGFLVSSAAVIYDDCSIIWTCFENVIIDFCNRGELCGTYSS